MPKCHIQSGFSKIRNLKWFCARTRDEKLFRNYTFVDECKENVRNRTKNCCLSLECCSMTDCVSDCCVTSVDWNADASGGLASATVRDGE